MALGLKLRKLNNVGEFFKKLPRFLAKKAFLVSLILIFTALIFGGLAFYKYSFLADKKEPEILEKPELLNEAAFQEILKIRQERQERLDRTEFKEYHNSFQSELAE